MSEKEKDWECPKCGCKDRVFEGKYDNGWCANCGYCSLGHEWEDSALLKIDGIPAKVCVNCGHIKEVIEGQVSKIIIEAK